MGFIEFHVTALIKRDDESFIYIGVKIVPLNETLLHCFQNMSVLETRP
jgi:hypothetical protein